LLLVFSAILVKINNTMRRLLVGTLAALTMGCGQKEEVSIGSIERFDPALDVIVSPEAEIEILGEGFNWSEGPLWIEHQQMLLFSDVPENKVYKWTESGGVEVYLTPSGYTGDASPYSEEEGSNGLTLTPDGKLVLCQHGDRKVSIMDAPIESPKPVFVPLADNFNGSRLNSPNDAVFSGNGDLFFTDPPYGMPGKAESAAREIAFHGVYRVRDGSISLITDSITRPNGLALLPGDQTLLVANSDPDKAVWYAFDLLENDSVGNARIFFDGSEAAKVDAGNPDGMKVDRSGNVFATGPGGVWIFDRAGKLLGKIKLSQLASNCCLSPDQKTLYVTADMYLLRIRLRE
jgi:gluconolactonase